MPKKLLKRFMIAEEKLMHNKALLYVSRSILQHNVWHLNRRSASRAMFIGLFWAFIPIPFQMIPAAILCIFWRANLPLTIALVWLTNPITMPPIFYAAHKIGAYLLGTPPVAFKLTWSWAVTVWKPLLLGSLIMAITFASMGYTAIDLFWRWTTVNRWKRRLAKRSKNQNPPQP